MISRKCAPIGGERMIFQLHYEVNRVVHTKVQAIIIMADCCHGYPVISCYSGIKSCDTQADK